MLSAVAYITVFFVRIPIMPAAPFLDYDPKDSIIVIGGFMFGPFAALTMSIVVALIQFFTLGATTGYIGLIMNAMASASFTCTAAYVYSRKKTIFGAVLGLFAGILVVTATMMLWNYIITPMFLGGVPRSVIAGMMLNVFLPFNLIKSGLNAAIAMLLYKHVSAALKSVGLRQSSDHSQTSNKFSVGVMLVSIFAIVTFVLIILAMQELI